MEALLIKTHQNCLAPSDPKTQEWVDKLKIGAEVHGKFKQYRNSAFHRKYFALLNIAFDHWEPGQIDSQYGTPEKNFDRFRKDLAILSGFYDIVIRIDGSTRIEARSISFASMSQTEFTELYSKTIDVLIKRIYNSQMTKEQIEELVHKYLEFT